MQDTLNAADERETFQQRIEELYLKHGGADIDAAIKRDRKVLELHQRELEHVATLPFDQHYRWRIAPSVGLRAQKDLERQQKRRHELQQACIESARRELGPGAQVESQVADAPGAQQLAQLDVFIHGAMDALNEWQRERAEASPSVTSAA